MTAKMWTEDGSTKKKAKRRKPKENNKPKVKKNKEPGSGNTETKSSEGAKKQQEISIGIKDLENSVLEYIIGQDEQVRQIISAIYRARVFSTIKSNVLVIGNSGTGKTATIKRIAETLGIPYTIEDATKYTQEGYYGADVTEMIYNLLENADGDLQRAWNGIIVIDEIDKKAGRGDEHDPAGVEVLKSLLKIIEGTTVMVDISHFMGEFIPFDTQNLIIIFMGAFPGLDKIRDRRLNRNSFGFAQSSVQENENSRYIKQDLVKYGLPEEFVGRIDTIVEMNTLGREQLVKILTRSKFSIFRRYEEELLRQGVTLKYDESIFGEIADSSLELDTGARELSNTINRIFELITYEILANPGKYTKCKLLPGIVEDNTRFKLS